MKILIAVFSFFLAFNAYSFFECIQNRNGERLLLAFQKERMGIVKLSDDEGNEIVYFGKAQYFDETETLWGGRYILNFLGTGQDIDLYDLGANLYILEGRKKVFLAQFINCFEFSHKDLESWIAQVL